MTIAINGYQQNYNYFQAKPVTEREAKPVYGGDNFFVNPPSGYTYPPQDLFSGKTEGLSGLVANASSNVSGGISVTQNLAAQAGYSSGVTRQSWIG